MGCDSYVSCSTNGISVTMSSPKMTKELLEDKVAEESLITTGHKFDDGQRKGTRCLEKHLIILLFKKKFVYWKNLFSNSGYLSIGSCKQNAYIL